MLSFYQGVFMAFTLLNIRDDFPLKRAIKTVALGRSESMVDYVTDSMIKAVKMDGKSLGIDVESILDGSKP